MTNKTKSIQLIDWLTCKDKLLHHFTVKEVNKALKDCNITVSDLTDERGFENYPTYMQVFEEISDKYRFTKEKYFHNTDYSKRIDVQGWKIRVKAQYQGLKHGKIIFQLLKNKYKWFDSFYKTTQETKVIKTSDYLTRLTDIPEKYRHRSINSLLKNPPKEIIKRKQSLWNLYECSSKDYEIYLETEHGTLYVPISALIKGDFSIIKERMEIYWKWYYNSPDRKEFLKKALMPLKSKECKLLKKYLSCSY